MLTTQALKFARAKRDSSCCLHSRTIFGRWIVCAISFWFLIIIACFMVLTMLSPSANYNSESLKGFASFVHTQFNRTPSIFNQWSLVIDTSKFKLKGSSQSQRQLSRIAIWNLFVPNSCVLKTRVWDVWLKVNRRGLVSIFFAPVEFNIKLRKWQCFNMRSLGQRVI